MFDYDFQHELEGWWEDQDLSDEDWDVLQLILTSEALQLIDQEIIKSEDWEEPEFNGFDEELPPYGYTTVGYISFIACR